jgi:muramoyltetrapeptide carboxypeptidase
MASQPVVLPPYLKKGDTVGIVCPAGFMDAAKVKECVRVMTEEWGFRVRVGSTVGKQDNYFSGSDEERLADLQAMMDDVSVKAILCGRGGYGTGRIIDQVDFRVFRKHPKWIIGFSDITVLHSHILARYKIASIHGPMANAFNEGGYKNEYVQSLQAVLKGRKMKYTSAPHRYNRMGRADGILTGGNLSLVAHLTGTQSEVDMRGKILFLEDVGEYLYNIDRMLHQLRRAGKFDGLAGLVLGGFTDSKDTTTPFGKNIDQILFETVRDFDFPVCFGFPVSHEKENVALKVGASYSLRVTAKGAVLRESVGH